LTEVSRRPARRGAAPVPAAQGEIVWLNGAFGAGKSTVAAALHRRWPEAVLYDPEEVGFLLRRLLPAAGGDFQDLPPWRPLVVETAVALHRYLKAPLIAPMTLLRPDYAAEIFGGLAARGLAVRHFLLHAAESELRRRIETHEAVPGDAVASAGTRAWRLDHLGAYRAALPWLTEDAVVVDTSTAAPDEVAQQVLKAVGGGRPRSERWAPESG
jgi:hypothetical protein